MERTKFKSADNCPAWLSKILVSLSMLVLVTAVAGIIAILVR
jgi:hypothetical protein